MAEVAPKTTGLPSEISEQRELIFDKFRRWGYLAARLDPLGFLPQVSPAELDDTTPWSSEARVIYCGTVGVEFTHIGDPQRREWIASRMEYARGAKPHQERILERLVRAELFEQSLQARFVGTKRYSIEGLAVLIPLLDQVVEGELFHHERVEIHEKGWELHTEMLANPKPEELKSTGLLALLLPLAVFGTFL